MSTFIFFHVSGEHPALNTSCTFPLSVLAPQHGTASHAPIPVHLPRHKPNPGLSGKPRPQLTNSWNRSRPWCCTPDLQSPPSRRLFGSVCQCLCNICSLHIGKPPWRGGSWLMGPPACSLRPFPQQNLRVCRMNQCLTNSQLGWGIQSALLLTPVQLFALKSRRTCGCEDNKALKPDWRIAHAQM